MVRRLHLKHEGVVGGGSNRPHPEVPAHDGVRSCQLGAKKPRDNAAGEASDLVAQRRSGASATTIFSGAADGSRSRRGECRLGRSAPTTHEILDALSRQASGA
jgi:hypothetical protein